MATINLGAIKFNWKGAYAGGTAYTVDDVVSSGGSSYVCILASTGNATSNGTYWELMSSAGTNGTDGSNGTDVGTVITTQGDLLYRDGSGLQRLAKGTASKVLAMNSGATAPEWVTAGGGTVLKVYNKAWVGGSSIGGSSSTWRAVSDYITPTITPVSSSSKFLIQWTVSGYGNDDHHFFKIKRQIGSTITDVGLSASNMKNDTDYGDSGSMAYGRMTNMVPLKTMHIQDAPATSSDVKWQLYNQAHGTTFYFGRSGHNVSSKQYAAQNQVTIWEFDGSKTTFSQDTGA